MTLTGVEQIKIENFVNDLKDNQAVEAIYIFPYTSVSGKDRINVVAIINDGLLEEKDKLMDVFKNYKTNVGYKKTLSFMIDSMDNYKKDSYNIHSLKALSSGTLIFDRYNVYNEIREEYRNNIYLNTTSLDRNKPIR